MDSKKVKLLTHLAHSPELVSRDFLPIISNVNDDVNFHKRRSEAVMAFNHYVENMPLDMIDLIRVVQVFSKMVRPNKKFKTQKIILWKITKINCQCALRIC